MLSYKKCKELQEVGFTNEIQLKWVVAINPHDKEDFISIYLEPNDCPFKIKEVVPCPSFEEIWNQLPNYFENEEQNLNYYGFYKTLTYNILCYSNEENIIAIVGNEFQVKVEIKENNVTEAAADMWLFLKKAELLNTEINNGKENEKK